MNYYLSTSSSSSSSSDDNLPETIVQLITASEHLKGVPKNEDYSEITVDAYSEDEFRQHFRVSREIVEYLSTLFETSQYFPKLSTGFERIPAKKCLQIFLWFVGHEAVGFRDVADRFNISISKLHKIIEVTSYFLSNLSPNIIKWPSEEEKITITEGFNNMRFPGVLGAIDGTHFKIDTPQEDPISYFNRKKYYSLHMQAVCDDKKRFRDVFIGFPGSVHDSRVFRNSNLSATLQDKCGDKYILGDSGYPCLRNLLTPYKSRPNLNHIEINFNNRLSHCRVVIEHAFGILKQRFRILYHIKLKKIENICHLIRACCVLHNLCIDNGVENINIGDKDVQPNIQVVEGDQDDADDEDADNLPGLAYRNYIASILNI